MEHSEEGDMLEDLVGGGIFGGWEGVVPLSSSSSIVQVSRKSRSGSRREIGEV